MNIRSKVIPTFCPGCHNFVLYAAIQQVINQSGLDPKKLVMVFDIGCIGNMADFFAGNIVHALHGRCVPTAVGIKLADPSLTVLAIGGDGGIYGEGMGHLIASVRANYPITTLVANNQLYSLTTGQTSPTTPKSSKTKSTPLGSPSIPVKPVSLVKSISGDVLVESVDCTKMNLVIDSIKRAIVHPGFSLLDLSQVCVTFGKQFA